MSFNLHGVVRGAIQAVNPDIPGTVYVSTGYTNTRGILTPTYNPVPANLQIQAKAHDPVKRERGLSYTTDYLTIYAFGDFSDLERPDNKGGDIVNFNNMWYYIAQVTEWWPDWSAFDVARQLNAATIAALTASLANGENLPA